MMRKLLQASMLMLTAQLSITHSNAQQYYNQTSSFLKYNSVWTFYNKIKLNFNNGSASIASLTGTSAEGCASVANPVTGALMFYSNGGSCWNANNELMAHGTGLLGNSSAYSSAQGVCIVPVPGSTQQYYLFSLESSDGVSTTAIKLYYSIVDMSLNNGLGDIVASSKNTLLDGLTVLGEAMVAVQGDNCDVWLVLHKKKTPDFKAYHITTAGINPTAVLSTTGGQIQGTTTVGSGGFVIEQDAYEQCSMAISPNRHKLAVSCQHIGGVWSFPVISTTGRSWGGLLCDFNPATGIVSNAILIDTATQYSAAFSPDNSKLYYTTVIPGSTSSRINQSTISSNDSATIVSSATVVHPSVVSDGLISIRSYNDTIYVLNPATLSLDRINKPNLSGAACSYQSNAITFPAATAMGASLPAEVVGAAAPDTLRSAVLDTAICSGWSNGILLQATDQTLSTSYTWNTGTTASSIHISAAGTYWVKYGNSCHYRVDTFIMKGSDLNPVISVNGATLSTTLSYSTYQWYLNNTMIPGATASTYTATENGAYTVVVGDALCTDTSAPYTMSGLVGIGNVNELTQQIKIYPNPTRDMVYIKAPMAVNVQVSGIEGRILKTVNNTHQITMGDLTAGIYMLRISAKDGTLLKVEKLIKEK